MKIKLAIAHRQLSMMKMFESNFSHFPHFEILWVAHTGTEVIQKCTKYLPDVLLLDLDIERSLPASRSVIQYLMLNSPCAILILIEAIRHEVNLVFEALGSGAWEVIDTSNLKGHVDRIAFQQVVSKIYKVVRLINSSIASPQKFKVPYLEQIKGRKSKKESKQEIEEEETDENFDELPPLLVIGASTGGPKAILQILSALPNLSSLAIVIVQHISEYFVKQMVKWLESHISIPVKMIQKKVYLKKGEILVAATNHHLILNKNRQLVYTEEPRDQVYRPSIDVFFLSVAKYWPSKNVAVLLTGMGQDGARGLKALYDAGWYTIAQHEEGCVIYGMPKAAIELKAVSKVLRIQDIAADITAHFEQKKGLST